MTVMLSTYQMVVTVFKKLEDWIFMYAVLSWQSHLNSYKKCLKILYIAFSLSFKFVHSTGMPEPREPITQ